MQTIQDAKKLADMAAAAKVYAEKAKLGQEAIDYANEIRVEALRLLGGDAQTDGPGEGNERTIAR